MRKSELPVGSVGKIGERLAVKYNNSADEGHNWRYIISGESVGYDDVYKASWDLVSTPDDHSDDDNPDDDPTLHVEAYQLVRYTFDHYGTPESVIPMIEAGPGWDDSNNQILDYRVVVRNSRNAIVADSNPTSELGPQS